MDENKNLYLWYTDTHLDKIDPITKLRFIHHIRKENPKGIFLTGDISSGPMLCFDLKLIAKCIKCPIYFVLGNHDYYFYSFEDIHNKINKLCKEYPNLIWLDSQDTIKLTEEVGLIGERGWYSAQLGNPDYLKYTLDWRLIKDFRSLTNMSSRIEMFRDLAKQSANAIEEKLELALEQNFKTIYILTHFPPWKEATRDAGKLLEKFWLPYNVNLEMGKSIEKIMKDRKKRNVIVLSGHIHQDTWIHVFRNIECKVNAAKYYGFLRNEERIFI